MALFRADEAAERGFERAKKYLVNREASPADRDRAMKALYGLVDELGPVIEYYPSWHPLVAQQRNPRSPIRTPGKHCGYHGLDHTVHFAHGFVTCPYREAEKVIESAQAIEVAHGASITARRLDEPLYYSGTEPVVVKCDWHEGLEQGQYVPKGIAVGLMLDQELPHWHTSEVGESWETMREYFLGGPHGARSSHFVSQDTAMAMKRVWQAITEAGIFGPVRF